LDVLSRQDEGFITKHDLVKGAMTLVDRERSTELYDLIHENAEVVAGGSVANTAAAVAMLMDEVGFVGCVNDDLVGSQFAKSIEGIGVTFHAAKTTKEGSGCCLVTVTPDGERTMNTYLGAALELSPDDIDEKAIMDAQIVYLEGYTLDYPEADDMFDRIFNLCKVHGTKLAFTLSDPWLIDRHRAKMMEMMKENVDILFANEAEIVALLEVDNFEDAVKVVNTVVPFAALTKGAEGAVICEEGKTVECPALSVEDLVDTTGAGDMFAAGVLYGILNKLPPKECGMLGNQLAGHIITQLGARPKTDLKSLFKSV